MLKKIYYCETEGQDLIISAAEDGEIRWIDNELLDAIENETGTGIYSLDRENRANMAFALLRDGWGDDHWNDADGITLEQLLDGAKIIAETEIDTEDDIMKNIEIARNEKALGWTKKWTMYETTHELRESIARRMMADELINAAIDEGSGTFVAEYDTHEEAQEALKACTSIIYNERGYYGMLTMVSCTWIESAWYDADGEYQEGIDIDYNADTIRDDRNLDSLIEDIVGDEDDYIEAAAAAYETYAPDDDYDEDDLQSLAHEYMTAFTDYLKENATADDLHHWCSFDTDECRGKWETRVDARWFEVKL